MSIVILPLDDRPVNYDYPGLLAAILGEKVLVPPRQWLGNPWRGSEHALLVDWLVHEAPNASALIIAADTLAYGGLIPSRQISDSFETVVQRLNILSEIKSIAPNCQIYASSVILRINRSNSSEEEKPYWATYGERMFRLSYLEHKISLHLARQDELTEHKKIKQQIPGDVYDDYLALRARNHAVNKYMLELVNAGVINYLLLPQDDTADYGWNIAEARTLQQLIRRQNLTEKAISYPGADEIGCLLLTKYFCDRADFAPRLHLRFSSTDSASLITEYEDRPMIELVKAHLAPLASTLTDEPAMADLQLFINAPAIKQGIGEFQWAGQFSDSELLSQLPPALRKYGEDLLDDPAFQSTRLEMQTPRRSPEEFARAVITALRANQPVAIADVAFVNGSDLTLSRQLVEHPELVKLAGYGGWNTAGNTLGCVLSQAIIYLLAKRQGLTSAGLKAHLEFLALRIIDDYFYQAEERSLCMLKDLPEAGLEPSESRLPDGERANMIQAKVSERLVSRAQQLEKTFRKSGLVHTLTVPDIYLPWQRLFEVGCHVEIELSKSATESTTNIG